MRIVERDGTLLVRDSPGLHWSLGGRRTHSWPIGEVQDVRLAESKDDEDGPVFRVEIVLRDGRAVRASLLWTHGRGPAEAALKRLRETLELPQPAGT